MKIGTETEADKKDSKANPLAGLISGLCSFLPLAPFYARGILIKEEKQLLCWDSLGKKYVSSLLSSESLHLRKVEEWWMLFRGKKRSLPVSLGRFIGMLGAQERSRGIDHWKKDRRIGLSWLHYSQSRKRKVAIMALTYLSCGNGMLSSYCLL